jgi:polyribonucleotide nucleotidyltransferase
LISEADSIEILGILFNGHLSDVCEGYQNIQYLLNPIVNQLKDYQLNLVVANTKIEILMIKSKVKEL